MSGLALFGFKMPSLLQFEKDKTTEPFIRRNLLAPEPIVKGDGATKNNCERNASKRLLSDLRREHPHLRVLIVEDGLASNAPHLSLLDSLNMNYVIGVKAGDHAYLFDWIKDLKPMTYTQWVG
jgi:hypothetical protein